MPLTNKWKEKEIKEAVLKVRVTRKKVQGD